MKGLTEKQRRVFEFIKVHIVRNNRPPTIREIGKEFAMNSTGSVRDVLRALVKKGFIEKDPGVSRGIRIKVGPGPISGEIVDLPVIARITPGIPIYDYQNFEETLKVDSSLVPKGDIFAIKVRDDSMADAGITEGDYAFVRRQPTCRPGHVVAVVLDNKVELREFSKKGRQIHLIAKTKRYKPVSLDPEKFRAAILGVLVGIFRRF